ncbi:MAG: bifunctional nuclease family protein [Acidobacteriota bacterium]
MSNELDLETWAHVEIKGLMLDPGSNVPIVILRERGSDDFLPIWIGVFEANAIALKLENVESQRPMTHDLMTTLLEKVSATVHRIEISDLSNNTFYAKIVIDLDGDVVAIDSRPSDAMALALRVDAPIYVARTVLDRARSDDLGEKLTDEEKIRKLLEEIDPDDLNVM